MMSAAQRVAHHMNTAREAMDAARSELKAKDFKKGDESLHFVEINIRMARQALHDMGVKK